MSNLGSIALGSIDDLAYMHTGQATGDDGFMQTAATGAWMGGAALSFLGGRRYMAPFSTAGRGLLRGMARRWGNPGQGGARGLAGRFARGRLEAQVRTQFESRVIGAGVGAFQRRIGSSGLRAAVTGGFAAAAREAGGVRAAVGVGMVRAGGALLTASNIAFMAPLALEAGRAVGSGLAYLGQDRSRLDFGSNVFDTQQAYTQRQAGLQAIHNSQLNTRSFFGREAEQFHQ